MPSIGAKNFTVMIGTVRRPGQELEDISRPKVDGVAYGKGAIRAPISTLRTVATAANAAAAATLENEYAELKGTLQTVADDHGTLTSNVIVLDAIPTRIKQGGVMVGGADAADTYIVEYEWQVRATE